MSETCVSLIGGSGFVGSELAFRLAERFDEVRVLSRRAARARQFRVVPNIEVVETRVHDAASLSQALAGSTVVVNLVGILNEAGHAENGDFSSAHEELTGKVLDACREHGIERYLHMSALNADAESGSSEYLKSKGRAEDRVRAAEGVRWTIFRPSIIFGEKDAFFNRFRDLLRALPVFPLAVPESRMAPVWVGDVCQVMLDSIDDPAATRATMHLCGPRDYSLRELVEYTAAATGMKRVIVGLPDVLARLQARVMEFVPGKPFSLDNYRSLQTDSVCPNDCARQPTSIESLVPSYLGKAGWSGRLQGRRAMARR